MNCHHCASEAGLGAWERPCVSGFLCRTEGAMGAPTSLVPLLEPGPGYWPLKLDPRPEA